MATGALVGLSLAQAYGQARAEMAQGEYQNRMSDINARYAEKRAEKAIEAGEKQAIEYKKKINQTIGAQRTGFASQGVDVGFGSAQDVQKETREVGYRDMEEIRTNAFLEAMGYRQQASEMRRTGQLSLEMSRGAAANSLLSGGIRAASMYQGKGK